MKFTVKNLGPIRDASIELGKLTVICGKNNCGKTYLAYTLDTFLDTIEYNLRLPLHQADMDILFGKGSVDVRLENYVHDYLQLLKKTVPAFTETLPRFLTMADERFAATNIDIPLTREEILASMANTPVETNLTAESMARLSNTASLAIRRFPDPMSAKITMINADPELPARKMVESVLEIRLAHLFNCALENPLFPKSFIITCERTGTALFRSELMGVKVRKEQEQTTSREITGYRGYGYQRPVEKDIEFVLDLERLQHRKSFIAEQHPEILDFFSTISGGDYAFDESINQMVFKPQGANCLLALTESSSTVRALAELHFYLKHMAKRGQILMMDEPEINLHPENQRKLARLFALLVKAGLRVFITTHSDYIVREINVLLRMNALKRENASQLARRHGYLEGEELSPEDVKVFVLRNGYTEEVLFNSDNHIFGVPSFDDTIAKFNAVYRDLMDIGL